jgi:hypothetical protein
MCRKLPVKTPTTKFDRIPFSSPGIVTIGLGRSTRHDNNHKHIFLTFSYRHINTREESFQFSTLVTNTLAQSVLLGEEIAFCSESYIKHINTLNVCFYHQLDAHLQMCIKLVIKTNLYYDARSKKHHINTLCGQSVDFFF